MKYLTKQRTGVAEIPVSTIIGEYMSLKKNGTHMVNMPFHNANTDSSFRATDSKHRYKCFACGAGGNGVDFVSRFKGIGYRGCAFSMLRLNMVLYLRANMSCA